MAERPVNLNWGPIMKQINESPHEFFQTGGWSFLGASNGAEEVSPLWLFLKHNSSICSPSRRIMMIQSLNLSKRMRAPRRKLTARANLMTVVVVKVGLIPALAAMKTALQIGMNWKEKPRSVSKL